MSEKSIFSYQNNSSYRSQIQVNEEYHQQFLKFPFKQHDSVVESGASCQISRRHLSEQFDIQTQDNLQNKTILQALNEAEKENQERKEKEQNKSSFQALPNHQQNSVHTNKMFLSQTQEQNNLNTVFNIEETDFKVLPVRLMKILKLLVNIQHFFRIISMNTRIFNKLNQHQHDRSYW
ncbi:hypothetical protein ABPG72_012221 [Tetrahymena utriculariae]